MPNNALSKKFNKLSLLKFALPNIIMMVFMSLYDIVDGVFIARYLGEIAFSATNMFYPITCVQLAISIMLATGASALIAKWMGEGNIKKARENFTFVTLVSLLLGIIVAAICIPTIDGLLTFLGTSELQMESCRTYALINLYFSPMLFLQAIFQMFFVTAGKPKLGLVLTTLGGLTNILFDYIFMDPLKMGVFGAGLASGIGYCIPALFGLIYFTFNRKGALYFTKFHFDFKFLWKSCTNGSSEMISNVATAVTTFLYNIIFMKYWQEDGVAAVTILGYFQFVFSAIFMGFSMGIAPIISFKYGAGDTKQLHGIVNFGYEFLFVCSICVYGISLLVIKPCLTIFTAVNSPVYNLAISGFHLFAIQFLFMAMGIGTSSMFTALGNGLVSGIISVSRTLIFIVICLLALPALFGEIGVWLAVPIAEILGAIESAIFYFVEKKKYKY